MKNPQRASRAKRKCILMGYDHTGLQITHPSSVRLHNRLPYRVVDLMYDLRIHQPQIIVVWSGRHAIEITLDCLMELIAERGCNLRYPRSIVPYVLSIPCPGIAIVQRSVRQDHRCRPIC